MIVLDDIERDTHSDFVCDDRPPATSRYQGERDDDEGGYDGELRQDSRMRAKNGMYHFHI